jgi:hypothetical protein
VIRIAERKQIASRVSFRPAVDGVRNTIGENAFLPFFFAALLNLKNCFRCEGLKDGGRRSSVFLKKKKKKKKKKKAWIC